MLRLRGHARKGQHTILFPFRLPGPSHARGVCSLMSLFTIHPAESLEIKLTAEWPDTVVKELRVPKADYPTTSPAGLTTRLNEAFSAIKDAFSAPASFSTVLANTDMYKVSFSLPPGMTIGADAASWDALGIEASAMDGMGLTAGGKWVTPVPIAEARALAVTNTLPETATYESDSPINPSHKLTDILKGPAKRKSNLLYTTGRIRTRYERTFYIDAITANTNRAVVEALEKCLQQFQVGASLIGELSASWEDGKLNIAASGTDYALTFAVNRATSRFLGIGVSSFKLDSGSSGFRARHMPDGTPPAITPLSGFEPPATILSPSHTARSVSYVHGRGEVNALGQIDARDRVTGGQQFAVDNSSGQPLVLAFVDGFLNPLQFEDDFDVILTCSFKPLY